MTNIPLRTKKKKDQMTLKLKKKTKITIKPKNDQINDEI